MSQTPAAGSERTPETVGARTNSASDRFSLTRRSVLAAVSVALIGALVGGGWQATRSETSKATVRVAFIEDVGYGNLDAERSLILDDGSARIASETTAGVQSVDFVVPGSRSFIDIAVTGDDDESAIAGANAAATSLIATERAERVSRLEQSLAVLDSSIDSIATDVTALEELMSDEAATEVDANAQLSGDLTAEDRASFTLAARLANDRYATLTSERDALNEQRNAFLQERIEIEAELRGAGNLHVVGQSSLQVATGPNPVASAAVGGALIGFGLALFAMWVVRRRPDGNE